MDFFQICNYFRIMKKESGHIFASNWSFCIKSISTLSYRNERSPIFHLMSVERWAVQLIRLLKIFTAHKFAEFIGKSIGKDSIITSLKNCQNSQRPNEKNCKLKSSNQESSRKNKWDGWFALKSFKTRIILGWVKSFGISIYVLVFYANITRPK